MIIPNKFLTLVPCREIVRLPSFGIGQNLAIGTTGSSAERLSWFSVPNPSGS